VQELKEQGIKKGNNAFKVYKFLDEREAKTNKDGKVRKKKSTGTPLNKVYQGNRVGKNWLEPRRPKKVSVVSKCMLSF